MVNISIAEYDGTKEGFDKMVNDMARHIVMTLEGATDYYDEVTGDAHIANILVFKKGEYYIVKDGFDCESTNNG
jgi:hypothetical protein